MGSDVAIVVEGPGRWFAQTVRDCSGASKVVHNGVELEARATREETSEGCKRSAA